MANVKHKQHQRRGAAIVETAIVLMVLLLLTFSIIEYGWLFQKMGHITNAARQGARVAARPNATVATVNAAVTEAMNLGNIPSASYTVAITSNNAAVTNLGAVTPGQPIEVKVTVEYSDPASGIGINVPIIPVPSQLKSKMVMVKEGP
jgi:Flp pilus assembly protein TadG